MSPAGDRDPTDLGIPGWRDTSTNPTETAPEPAPHRDTHDCTNGWTGDEYHPSPCPTCRPHLTHSSVIHRPGCPINGWRLKRAHPKANIIARCTSCGAVELRKETP